MYKSFIEKVNDNLRKTLSPHLESVSPVLLLAVSGGADSVSLLCACAKLANDIPIAVYVLTVNHNLRPADESAGDVRFVQNLCEKLNIPCEVAELSGEEICSFAAREKCGLEAAARHFRYAALHKHKAKIGADFILTAHNRDDYYETVLMRLFQGGNPESLAGLQMKRGFLLRPLLNISRAEILAFLNECGQDYRTDSTNRSTDFLRNRLRLTLTPALDKTFPNWQKGLDKTLTKIALDCEALNFQTANIRKLGDASVVFEGDFLDHPTAIRRRILMECFSLLGIHRLSFSFINKCSLLKRGETCEIGKCGVKLTDVLTVYKKTDKISGFSVWVDSLGEYYFPHGTFRVSLDENFGDKRVRLSFRKPKSNYEYFGSFELPFYVRSILPGDKIQIAESSFKSVKKLFSEAKVPERMQALVPLIEHKGVIKGIWGEAAGWKNRRAFFRVSDS